MKLNLTVSVDDVCPKKGYRIIGEPAEKWFRELNEEFGAKFDLFVPSDYHGRNKLTNNRTWIQELHSIPWISLNCHGHYHECINGAYGEMEMFEPNPLCAGNINKMLGEWNETLGDYPKGWRSPGWMINERNKELIEKLFDYVAIHYEHNQGMKWDCKTFFGHDGIQQTEIGIHNVSEDGETGMVMFQSHIAGNHNDNVWNQKNFDQLKLSLEHLVQTQNCTFKTLKECL